MNRRSILVLLLFSFCPLLEANQCTIILVRHGETDLNVQQVLQGDCNTALNDRGNEQAKAVAEKLSSLPLARIYSSPLLRAVQTAQEIQKKHKIPLILIEDLKEFSFGSLEGAPVSRHAHAVQEAINNGLYETKEQQWNFRMAPGAESRLEVFERSMQALKEICRENPNQRVIVVTHGGVMKSLLEGHLNKVSENFRIANTATIKLTAFLDSEEMLQLSINEMDGVEIPKECL